MAAISRREVALGRAIVRQKLAEYYRTEGVEDPVSVDVPKGGFKVTFEQREMALGASIHRTKPRKCEILGALLAMAAACAFGFGFHMSGVQGTGLGKPASPGAFEGRALVPEPGGIWNVGLQPGEQARKLTR